MNHIILDDKQVMAGSFRRYFKYRFGSAANIFIVKDAESCLKKIDIESRVIILNYHFNGNGLQKNGKNVLDKIKEQKPETDVVVLSSDEASQDIIKATRKLEKQASNYITKTNNLPLRTVSTIKNTVLFPIRIFVDEFSIADFLYMYLILFVLIGFLVMAGRLSFKLL